MEKMCTFSFSFAPRGGEPAYKEQPWKFQLESIGHPCKGWVVFHRHGGLLVSLADYLKFVMIVRRSI